MKIPDSIRKGLADWAQKKIASTPPDFIIRPQGQDQTLRWWIIPRNRFFNIYLHKFVLSDEDRALHDHPWWNASILLVGDYIEWVESGDENIGDLGFCRHAGYVYTRRASKAHRVELFRDDGPVYKPVITLFLTGPKIREWGFLCPKGWRHWSDFCDARDHGVIGKGCE